MKSTGRIVAIFFLAGCGAALAAPTANTEALCPEGLVAPITLTGAGMRAVVTRSPFHIEFQNAAGAPVLSEVPPASGRIHPVVNITEPLGSDTIRDVSLYAPLSFERGGGLNLQFPGGPWVGNQLTGADAGLQFFATAVTAADCSGGKLALTLATSDPLRHTILLNVQADESGANAMQLRAQVTPKFGVTAVSDSFASGDDEQFYGFGGRHNALSQRGHSFPIWAEQENFDAGPLSPLVARLPGTGGDAYLFPNGPTAAYYPQALFVSSRPYGFLLENTALSRFRLAYSTPDAWQVSTAGNELRYTVAAGDNAAAIGALATINGRHRPAPLWALGPTLDRGVRVLSAQADTAASYEARMRDDLAQIDAAALPVTSYRIEGWNILSRPVLADLVAEFRRRGIHPMFYIRAYVAADAANTEPSSIFEEAVSRGYVAKAPGGVSPYLFGSPFIVGVAALIDFSNPAAVLWWQGRIREMLDLGADGFMEDFGEQVQSGMVFADGTTGLSMHNRYPILYHAATRAAVDRYQQQHPERGELFFFTRTGYSGRSGSAASENANFPGDETTDWSRASGLASIITDMLNRGIGGAYGFNTDIGGYEDVITPAVTKELFLRWSEAAALMPIFRVHNSSTTGVKMPYSYDAETLAIWKAMAALHARAAPLILRLWQDAQTTGLPITRPLWLAYPGDAQARAQDQEFLLGPDVLVAPVVAEAAVAREVYFPAGCWFDPQSGQGYAGRRSVAVSAPLARLPYFFRCGTRPF